MFLKNKFYSLHSGGFFIQGIKMNDEEKLFYAIEEYKICIKNHVVAITKKLKNIKELEQRIKKNENK